MRPALLAVMALLIPTAALAQDPPRCAASGWDPLRTADQIIADIARHRCAPGSRIDVAVTDPGQAVQLTHRGICAPDTVRTRGVNPTPERRVLALRCELAAR